MSQRASAIQRTIHVQKTVSRPTSVKFGRYRRYRWNVGAFRLIEGQNSGVLDQYQHVSGDWGWSFTRWGAMWSAARCAITSTPKDSAR